MLCILHILCTISIYRAHSRLLLLQQIIVAKTFSLAEFQYDTYFACTTQYKMSFFRQDRELNSTLITASLQAEFSNFYLLLSPGEIIRSYIFLEILKYHCFLCSL